MAGLIFVRQSPRRVTVTQARRILNALPATVDSVGVFLGEDPEKVLGIANRLGLRWVQWYDSLSVRQVTAFHRAGLRVIQVFTIRRLSDYHGVYRSPADLVMLDNRTGEIPGGTGRRFDWKLRPPRRIPNLVLAGGLNADNVAEGVRRFRPLVVDVNSGVESRPGIKSRRRLVEFFEICDRIRYGW